MDQPTKIFVVESETSIMSAPCKDCGKDTEPVKGSTTLWKQWDLYIVRDEVWAEAGMNGWSSGYLCTPCLSKRLGRTPTNDDYLARPVSVSDEGIEFEGVEDYLEHPSVVQAFSGG